MSRPGVALCSPRSPPQTGWDLAVNDEGLEEVGGVSQGNSCRRIVFRIYHDRVDVRKPSSCIADPGPGVCGRLLGPALFVSAAKRTDVQFHSASLFCENPWRSLGSTARTSRLAPSSWVTGRAVVFSLRGGLLRCAGQTPSETLLPLANSLIGLGQHGLDAWGSLRPEQRHLNFTSRNHRAAAYSPQHASLGRVRDRRAR